MNLSPDHIEKCSKEISRWSKAIRLIQTLAYHLPDGFPEPDLIEPDHKPFDLRVIWHADNEGHSANLCKRIASALGLEIEWRPQFDGYWSIRDRVQFNGKHPLNLRLLVAKAER